MAVIRRIESQRSFDIGGIPSTQIDDSVGRGLQHLGGAISDHASTMAAMENRRLDQQMKMQEFATNQAFLRFEDDVSADYAEKQVNIDPSGAGFTDTVSGIYNARAEAFMKGVPDALKPKFAELLATSRNQWVDKAAATEVDQRNTWYRTGITDRANVLQMQVFNDPTMFDAAKQDAYRQIDASGLSPTEKEGLKRKTDEMFKLTFGQREIEEIEKDPSKIAGARQRLGIGGGAVDQFVDRIIGVESGGRADAKNPNSSATGAGQFISSTWLGMVRKYRPDLMNGRTNGEVLALRNDYALSREMTRLYAQENANFLAAQGLAQTPGNIYLAHFLGPRGAAQVLKAGPGASIESIVGADAVKANGFLAGKTTGWVADWAAKKMGGAKAASAPADRHYEGLTLEQRLVLLGKMEAAAQRGQTAINAQQKALYDAEKGSLELGIQTGDVASVAQIMSSNMNDAHKADLLSALRTRQGDNIKIAEAVAAFRAGNLRADPYSGDDRKTVDGVYDAIQKSVPQDQVQADTEDLIAQSGVVPQKVHNSIRAGLESTVPSDVEAALTQADRIAQINPAILGRREGGAEIQKKADLFDTLTRSMGYSAAEAAKRIADQNDPEKARQRAALLTSEPVKEMLKKVDDTTIARAISGVSLLGWKLGENEAQKAAMVSEYKSILQETIVDANGDETAAKDLANKRFERLYGASELTLANEGMRNVITRLPPEKVYDPMPDGSFDYIGGQLRESLASEGVAFDDVRLSPYEDTDTDFQNGEPPRYQVWFKQNGAWQLYHLPFYADRSAALEAYDAEQQQLLEERRQQMEQNRAEEQRRFPEGRDGPERFSNDELYYGAAREDSPMGRAIRRQKEKDAERRAERAREQAADPYNQMGPREQLIEQDRRRAEGLGMGQRFDTPQDARDGLMNDYLNGPLMPGSR